MIFGDTFRLSMRNLRQARLRTALTTIGVAIGVGALTCMMSLGIGLQEQVVGRFLKSGVFDAITVYSAIPGMGRTPRMNTPGGRRQSAAAASRPGAGEKPVPKLDDEALGRLAGLDRVKEVYPNLRVPAEVRFGTFSEYSSATGIPLSAKGEGVFQKFSHGAFFADEREDACMLGLDFAKRLGEQDPGELIGKELILGFAIPAKSAAAPSIAPIPGLSLQREERKFRVVGIIEREFSGGLGGGLLASVMIPLGKMREIGSYDFSNPQAILQQMTEKRGYSSATIKVRKPQDVEEVEKKIKDMGYSAFSLNDMLQGAKKAFILLNLLLSLTGSVALTVACLGIVNTMVMSILERTREIGIMKAIGGSDGDIRRIFLVEASVIGFLGGILGIALGWIVGKVINLGANIYIRSQGGNPETVFMLPWWLIAGSIAFAIAVSLLAGSYPAARAARLDPIQALRHD